MQGNESWKARLFTDPDLSEELRMKLRACVTREDRYEIRDGVVHLADKVEIKPS
jgi:hypothetical protein